jgi:DNA integrity scanning protein DisA with diadenylate cyclase activity
MSVTDTLDRAYGPISVSARCGQQRKAALEQVIQLAVEIAREGREGRKIGTLFVVGDCDEVTGRSHPLMLDPLHGHPAEVRHVSLPEFRETVKELAQLDGAFLVDDGGTFYSAGRYVATDVDAANNFLPGLGTRHAAAASITRATRATAVVVSQSSVVRVFSGGEVRAEIIPELFLMSREALFARDADVRTVPDLGLTMAVPDDSRRSGE